MRHFFSRLWNRFADSIATKTADRLYFQSERSRLLDCTLHSNDLGVTDRLLFDTPLIVSLTSHANRIHEAWMSIESIMQGSVLPNRIILWLGQEEKAKTLPQTLQLLQKRGLEIRYTEDIGPYTKLIPALQEYPDAIIVTIDDDMLYPYDTLELLVNSYRKHPDCISANRVLGMEIDHNHALKPLGSWKEIVDKTRISPLNFFEGVCGALYPPHCFNNEVFNREVFLSMCPTADDIWFNCMARFNHISVVSSNDHYSCFPLIVNESVQDNALWHNNRSGKVTSNDLQLNRVLGHYSLLNTNILRY